MKLDPKYAIVLALSLGLALTAGAIQNSNSGKSQSAQPAASAAASAQDAQTGATGKATSQSQPESLADRARKAKAANQQTQSGAQPKVFNQDNFATTASTTPASSGKTESPASGVKPADGKSTAAGAPAAPAVDKVDILQLSPEKSSITRPGGSNVNWQIQNKSEHGGPITLTFTVTGPCNYKRVNTIVPSLSPGQGYTDNMLASVVVYESECAGQYTMELSASAGGKLLNSKTSSISVQ